MTEYAAFLAGKRHSANLHGFDPGALPGYLFDFQADLVAWALRKGRAAIFADCGLGKTIMELVWAERVAQRERRPVLLLTPLAVSTQTIREAERFGIEAGRSSDGTVAGRITVTNYERLHHFKPQDFCGVVADESSILKSFDGVRRAEVTEFMRQMPYRLLATATAAPNDYIELGTSSEALGELGHVDMLGRFFRHVDNIAAAGGASGAYQFRFKHKERAEAFHGGASLWRFKGHAETPFWRWVCSWARAVRRPSDLGYPDDAFILPPLIERERIVTARSAAPDMLFTLPAVGLREQREERRRTIQERCEMIAAQVSASPAPALVWCHLNEEGDRLAALMPDARQVSGNDSDEAKEAAFLDFIDGRVRTLITKPKIGAWGLNFQHCARVFCFPSHSFEQYYQGVRRCWRFGQTRPVTVEVIATEGEVGVLKNLQRKAAAADRMFANLVAMMHDPEHGGGGALYPDPARIPAWLS